MYISLSIFTIYTIYALSINAKSYSDTYYSLKRKVIFIVFTWGISLSLIYAITDIKLILACFGLILVGAASATKESKTTKIAHWVGVVIAVIFSQLFIADLRYTALVVIGCLLSLFTKRPLLWSEFSLFSVLFLKIFYHA
jgi:hypothetical protein